MNVKSPIQPTRVLGRQPDLVRRGARNGEQRLCDALSRWSLDGNLDWLREGVRHDVPFLQVSPSARGSVLAWELERLRDEGYVPVGPCWVPLRWLHDRAGYQRVVRLVQAHVSCGPETAAPNFVPKVAGELEPLLAMWPHVLVLPTSQPLSIADLVALRAFPLHPLGVVDGPAFADGRPCTPAEFFAHDLDHARYKIREDLLAEGIVVEDPYRDGTTIEARTGAHRQILAAAVPHVGPQGWWRAGARAAWVRSVWLASGQLADRSLSAAARWLLFELLHEKGMPIDGPRLAAELASGTHVAKLLAKMARGFFGHRGPAPSVATRLAAAGEWLQEQFRSGP